MERERSPDKSSHSICHRSRVLFVDRRQRVVVVISSLGAPVDDQERPVRPASTLRDVGIIGDGKKDVIRS